MPLQTYTQSFTLGDYATEVRTRIRRVENPNLIPAVHFDGVSSIALGLGYDLLVHDERQVARDLAAPGVDIVLTTWQVSKLREARTLRAEASKKDTSATVKAACNVQIASIATELAAGRNGSPALTLGADFVTATPKANALFDFVRINEYELRLNALLNKALNLPANSPVAQQFLPDSMERIALLSLVYVGKRFSEFSGEFARALQSGNRAEVWYLIRYKSFISKDYYVQRAAYESSLFGLNESTPVDETNARNSIQMFERHRSEIILYEEKYKDLLAGAVTSGFDLPATRRLMSLTKSLDPAKKFVLGELRDSYSVIASSLGDDVFLSTNIYASSEIQSAVIDAAVNETSANVNGSNDILFGGAGLDHLSGGKGDDLLAGNAGQDVLNGGAGLDILIGGTGNDILVGGEGEDTYVFNAGDGNDTIVDSDGVGDIRINGLQDSLKGSNEGSTLNSHNQSVWKDGKGIEYTLLDGSLTNGGTLKISGGSLAGGDIQIKDFKNGHLGITLLQQCKLVIGDTGQSNPFKTDSGAVLSGVKNFFENLANGLKSFLNRPASDGDKLIVSLESFNGSDYALVTGDDTISFANGAISLDLQAGQTELAFAFINTGDVDADAALKLTATYVPVDGGEQATVDLTVNFDASEEADQPPATNLTINGDINPTDIGPEVPGIQADGDAQHNPIGTPQFYEDILGGSEGNDHIIAGELNDDIGGNGGDDWIEGGNGSDYIGGSSGNDLIEGGSGSDILIGEDGNDRLYADVKVTTEAGIENGDSATGSGQKGDWLSGNAGDDTLVGSADNDVLAGGAGADFLIAGAGDDNILGDADYIAQYQWEGAMRYSIGSTHWFHSKSTTFDWTVTPGPEHTLFAPVVGETNPVGGGADAIYAGAGNDHVWAGEGDDTVLGESGNDNLLGETGNDVLLGGSGDDELHGDASYVDDSEHGDDFLDGGEGDDKLYGEGGSDTLYGGAGNDTLAGDDSDTVADKQGDDYLDGEDGDDKLYGMGGADTLYGGAGDDLLAGDNGDTPEDLLGDDYLDGEDGNDELHGSGGADTLYGGAGDDKLYGDDDDTPDGKMGDDFLDGEDGDDELIGAGGNDTLIGGKGDDKMLGDSSDMAGELHGSDSLDGGDGDDQMVGGGGADTLSGGTGADIIFGDDSALAGEFHGADSLDGGDGDDQMVGGGGADTLSGGSGADILLGDDSTLGAEFHGDDTLDGGDGNDTLVGDGGADTLQGGEGNDILFGDADEVPVSYHGNDTLDGGAGDDVLVGGRGADSLSGGDGNDELLGDDGQGVFGEDDTLDGGAGDDRLYGDGGNDSLSGGDGNDMLVGGDGDDSLDGGEGDDTLFAGAGEDALAGGDGNDAYFVSAGSGNKHISDSGGSSDLLVIQGATFGMVRLGLGSLLIDTGVPGGEIHLDDFDPDNPLGSGMIERFQFDDGIFTYEQLVAKGLDFNGTPDVDVIYGTGLADRINALESDDLVFSGAGNDTLQGGQGDDVLYGEDDDDALDGGDGTNTLVGGAGNDVYWVASGSDSVIEETDSGEDTVVASVDYVLTDNVEDLSLIDDAASGTGNALDNRIEANVAADSSLFGLAGSDVLFGGDGSDYLDGGVGADEMMGGDGDDVYIVDDVADQVSEATDAGQDLVIASIDYTLRDNLERLLLTGGAISGTGNDLDNTIAGDEDEDTARTLLGLAGNDTLYGRGGSDLLDGGEGADIMVGGDGEDLYLVDDMGDVVMEAFGSGNDTVVSNIDYVLGENVENLELSESSASGILAVVGDGNALDNRLFGNSENNELYGEEGNDTLIDDSGNDFLDGGTGADLMIGGAGDDTYVVDDAGDQVLETGFADDSGVDLVLAWVDYTLAANLENLTLMENAGQTGTGNELDNLLIGAEGNDRLVGLDGNDILDGGTGSDVMVGGDGDDAYFVDNTDDVVDESSGSGFDQVFSAVSTTLGAGVEDLHLNGHVGLSGTGNELNNGIYGNAGANTLLGLGGNDTIDGGMGRDTMIGGSGDDTYVVDQWGDKIVELAGDGHDRVLSSASYMLESNVEELHLQGEFAGVEDREWLSGTGNELDNLIVGNGGNNYLSGLEGGDVIDGRSGNDRVFGGDEGDTLYGGDDAIYQDSGYGGEYPATWYSMQRKGDGEYGITYLASNDDEIDGGSGDDNIDGGSGNDQLYGGDGDDALFGGSDGLYVDNGVIVTFNDGYSLDYASFLSNNDVLDGGDGSDTLDGGSGNDDLYGGEGADVLYGGDDGPLNTSNDDYLNGGAGIDVMRGGSGNDTYIVDGTMELLPPPPVHVGCDIGTGDDEPEPTLRVVADTVIENADEGYDTIYSSVSMALPENVEAIYLDGSANIDVVGNADANFIIGNAGNNIINGGSGDDYMAGGSGDDTYYVDSESETVEEYDAGGIDTVRAYIDGYQLGDNLENLDLTNGVQTGFGNELDNRIRGNMADNVILGEGGNDRIAGTGGDDTLYGGEGDDVYFFGRGGGRDVIIDNAGSDKVVLVNGLSAENMTLTRSGDDLVIGFMDGNERLVLSGWLDGSNSVETVKFCGGPGFDRQTIADSASNEAPLALDDLASVREDMQVSVGGNVLANDSDLLGIPFVTNAGVYIGSYGTLSLAADGSYTYVLNNALPAIQSLADGQSVSDVFSYGISDGDQFNPLSANALLRINIDGTNDAPVTHDEIAVVSEDGVLLSSGNVLANDGDIDQGTQLQVLDAGVRQGTYGTLTLSADGSYGYALSNDSAVVQGLGGNEEVVDSFTYLASDGAAFTSASLLIRISGANDAPVAGDDLAALQEDAVISVSGKALANDSDAEQGTILSVLNPGSYTGVFGTLSLAADGTYIYVLDNSSSEIQSLAQDAVIHEQFGYTVGDGDPGNQLIAGATIKISIIGTNDAPQVIADAQMVREDLVVSAAGDVLLNDHDIDQGNVLTVVNAGVQAGSFGSLNLADNGSYAYVLDNGSSAVQSLAAWESASDIFFYEAGDGIATQGGALAITVAGTNDAPIVSAPLTNQAARIGQSFSWQFAGNAFADIDHGDVLSYSATQIDGSALPSWLVFDAGTRTFSGTPANGNAGSLQIKVAATDLLGASASQNLVIDVTGSNAPPASAPDCNMVSEDCILTANGNVLANDHDPEGVALRVADPGTRRGDYGTLTLGADGRYRYDLNNALNAVQSLGVGEAAFDRFTYGASDGANSTPGVLTVTINGRNDIPVLVAPLADKQLTKNANFSWKIPAGSFADIDHNDRLTYTATQSSGCALPSWLKFDAVTQVFSGHVPAGTTSSFDIKVTANDGHGANSYASDVFRISVGSGGGCGKGNEGVGNGEDPPPPGHDTNWNDGPGTSPGRPGSCGGNGHDDEPSRDHAKEQDDGWSDNWGCQGKSKDFAYVDLKHFDRNGDAQCGDHGQYRPSSAANDVDFYRRWVEMDRTLNRLMAESEGQPGWCDPAHGADPRGLGAIVQGGANPMRGGVDAVSLSAGTDIFLKGFRGLQEGISRLG